MDLNHTRLPIPPPERIHLVNRIYQREQDIIYSPSPDLQIPKPTFSQKNSKKQLFPTEIIHFPKAQSRDFSDHTPKHHTGCRPEASPASAL